MRLRSLIIILLSLSSLYSFGQITVSSNSNSGTGSFRWAISQASAGDTIYFADSLHTNGFNTIYLSSTLPITKGLVIEGGGPNGSRMVFHGQYQHRIMEVNIPSSASNRNLHLNDVVFDSAYVAGIDNPPFSTTERGGAMRIIAAGEIYLSNVKAQNCHADWGSVMAREAVVGAYGQPSIIDFQNCEITQNVGSSVWLEHVGDVNLNHVSGHHNNRRVFFVNNSGEFTIKNSNFHDNGDQARSEGTGAVVSATNQRLAIDSCTFTNNYSNSDGGGLVAYNGDLDLRNSSFIGNWANHSCGGASVRAYTSNYFATVHNCLFKDNHGATGTGGLGISRGVVSECIIRSNTAQSVGGGLGSNGDPDDSLIVNDCMIDSNYASNSGGGIHFYGDKIYINRTTVAYNSTGLGGGGIYFQRLDEMIMRSSTISHNSANWGGAIRVDNHQDANFRITNSTLAYNSGYTGGLFHMVNISRLKLKSCIIVGNQHSTLVYDDTWTPTLIVQSLGYNVVQNNVLDWHTNTDILGATAPSIGLNVLANNGGFGPTHSLSSTSNAVNSGTPTDSSDAQNGPIQFGRRDRGAHETSYQTNYVNEVVEVCDSVLFDGIWRTSTGTYSQTYTNQAGFDSTHVFTITLIRNTEIHYDTLRSCQPVTWIDGQSYSSDTSGVSLTYSNRFGCDSIMVLEYERLNAADSNTIAISSCNPYPWIDGNLYAADTITDWITFTNQWQCDSLVRLDFDHLPASDTTVLDTGYCAPITWLGGVYFDDDTTAYLSLQNQLGCDSVVQLNFEKLEFQDSTYYVQPTLYTSATEGKITWYRCSPNWFPLASAGDTNAYTPVSNGCYAAVIVNGPCRDTTNQVMVTDVSISEIDPMNIVAYPNPTVGNVTLQGDLPEKVEVVVSDVFGRQLFTIDQYDLGDSFELPNAPGVYLVSVISEDYRFTTLRIQVY